MNRIEKTVIALTLLLPLAAAADPAAPVRDDPLPGGMIEGEIDGRVVTCPLLKTDMKAYIHGDVATVELTQAFTNPHDKPMHARYVFPLPPKAAVYAMRMRIGQRVIEAQIKRKEEAEQVFEQAKAEGKQAALLTQHRPDVFTQQVANLMPGDRILVELRYAHAVPKRDGVFRYHFPMVVGPRYIPERRGAEGEPEPLEIGQWNLPASSPVAPPDSVDPERVGIEVHLDAGMPVRWMDSNSHVIDVHEKGVGKRLIRLAAGRTIDNQDFVLAYALAGKKVTAGVTTWARNGKGVLSVLIEPPARAAASKITPREMVFVLDCSGSMHGVPLDTSTRFMRPALANLRPTDRFRIIRFSHTASGFAETPLPATEKNIRQGLEFIDSLSGSGGTEMTTGIRAALDPRPVPGALRIVVFLTDGYVGNDADIVRLIRQRRGTARLFSFGIGNAVNRYLLSEMARAGRGAARYHGVHQIGGLLETFGLIKILRKFRQSLGQFILIRHDHGGTVELETASRSEMVYSAYINTSGFTYPALTTITAIKTASGFGHGLFSREPEPDLVKVSPAGLGLAFSHFLPGLFGNVFRNLDVISGPSGLQTRFHHG